VPPFPGTWTSSASVAAVVCSNGWTISSVSLWPFPAIGELFYSSSSFIRWRFGGAIYFVEVLLLNSFIELRWWKSSASFCLEAAQDSYYRSIKLIKLRNEASSLEFNSRSVKSLFITHILS
jgi:hypothetical protein